MNTRGMTILILAALTLSACGADRGLRFEQAGVTANQVEPGSTSGSMRVKSAITVLSPPQTMTLAGNTIWASVQFADRNQAIQAVDARTAQVRGIVDLPFSVRAIAALTSTPNVIWMVTYKPAGGHWELQRLGTRVEPARSAARSEVPPRFGPFATLEPVLSLPGVTEFLGATNSAVWLLTYHKHRYTLWRCDTGTLRIARFPLAGAAMPGVAITSQRIFVLLPAHHRHAVSIQTRDASGRVIAESPLIQLDGQLLPRPVSVCGTQIIGVVYRRGVSVAVRLDPSESPPRYSKRLSLEANGSYVGASTFGDHCRSVWVATVEQSYPGPSLGFVTRLDTSSLEVTGRIGNIVASGLLWADGSLWASDVQHAAVLRIG